MLRFRECTPNIQNFKDLLESASVIDSIDELTIFAGKLEKTKKVKVIRAQLPLIY